MITAMQSSITNIQLNVEYAVMFCFKIPLFNDKIPVFNDKIPVFNDKIPVFNDKK